MITMKGIRQHDIFSLPKFQSYPSLAGVRECGAFRHYVAQHFSQLTFWSPPAR